MDICKVCLRPSVGGQGNDERTVEIFGIHGFEEQRTMMTLLVVVDVRWQTVIGDE